MDHDPEHARSEALTAREPADALLEATLYVGDQLGELVTVAGADRYDRAADRVAARAHLAMACAGAVGVAATVGGILVEGGWGFVAVALVALLMVAAIAGAVR